MCSLELFIAFWRLMANSLKDHIRFVGTWYIPYSEGWGVKERKAGGQDGKGKGWSVFADTVTITTETQSCTRRSIHQFLPETSRDGSVFFRQQHWKLPQRVKINVYCTGTKIIPSPPFPELEGSKCKRGWGRRLLAPPASRERSARTPLGAPSSKGSARYYVGPRSLVSQSPFSSSFCKLFCIFSNFIMFVVSSRQRTSIFNCTCDPRPDGAVSSVRWVSTMEVSDPSCSSRVLILYLM